MHAMATHRLTDLSRSEASEVIGGCDCAAHCVGRTIGKAINWFFTEWPGHVTFDWTNK